MARRKEGRFREVYGIHMLLPLANPTATTSQAGDWVMHVMATFKIEFGQQMNKLS